MGLDAPSAISRVSVPRGALAPFVPVPQLVDMVSSSLQLVNVPVPQSFVRDFGGGSSGEQLMDVQVAHVVVFVPVARRVQQAIAVPEFLKPRASFASHRGSQLCVG